MKKIVMNGEVIFFSKIDEDGFLIDSKGEKIRNKKNQLLKVRKSSK